VKLRELCQHVEGIGFPMLDDDVDPDRGAVVEARTRVGEAVVDDEFIVDCIAHELERLDGDRSDRGLAPFFVLPRLGIRFAFGYWPPSSSAGAHEHTAWTITAVCRNHLEVVTYDRSETYRHGTLVAKNQFTAGAGRTGFIYEPCIHDPRNTSDDWSLSLHVTSPRDGRQAPSQDQVPPCLRRASSETLAAHPYARVDSVRVRRRFVHQLARILLAIEGPDAVYALRKCHRLGLPVTRRQIASRLGDAYVPQVLVRVDDALELHHRRDGGRVVLACVGRQCAVDELVVDELAHDAMARAADHRKLDINTLPGKLTRDECHELGDALESTGLFRREWQ
jgi:hypothetical protein